MKKIALVVLALALSVTSAIAQISGAATVGGMTSEVCSTPTLTASSAYTAGNEVGGLITLTPAWRTTQAQGAADSGGVVQSIRLNFKDAQTATFKAYQFVGNPSATTFTDKTTPAINAADAFRPRAPLTLATSDSGLGTMTVYGVDAIGRAHVAAATADYWVIVTTGTPTFGSATDMQFCATYLLD